MLLPHFLLWLLGLARPWTFYTSEECASLERYAAGLKRLVEIGCWQGVNTARLRRVMHPEGILYAVDPYVPGRLRLNMASIIAHREVNRISNGKVEWFRLTDMEAARFFRERGASFDFIFSDSRNDYEGFRATWEAWNSLLKKDGVYVLANSAATAAKPIADAGSVKFTREVILRDPAFRHVETVGCFTYLRKS